MAKEIDNRPADEVIGFINEYGEIERGNGEDIFFQAPIFTPPQENEVAPSENSIDVTIREYMPQKDMDDQRE